MLVCAMPSGTEVAGSMGKASVSVSVKGLAAKVWWSDEIGGFDLDEHEQAEIADLLVDYINKEGVR